MKSRRNPEETRLRIVKAAKECFDTIGENRTSLIDISRRAKVHRQTIYLFFDSRDAVVRAVLYHCIEGLVAAVRKVIENARTMEEAVMSGSIATTDYCRNDKTLNELLVSDGRFALQQISENISVARYFEQLWKPLFLRFRKSGEIKANWTYADFSIWLRGIQYVLVLHEELAPAAQRKLVRNFIRPWLASGT